jgi:transcriptional regulator with XRE-family HTH domain
MSTTIGQKIKEARKRKGMSQEDLASKVRCDKKTIYRVENGKSSGATVMRKIADALGLKLDEMAGETSDSGVRRRPVRRVDDGQEFVRLLLDSVVNRTEIRVEKDLEDEALHSAILDLCDAIDKLGGVNDKYPHTRIQYESGRTLAQSLAVLQSKGWVVELTERQEEVYGQSYDFECYWLVGVRPNPACEEALS